MCVQYHPGKANVVAGALSKLSIRSMGHVEEEKKELAKDVHHFDRFGVRLADSNDGGSYVQNGAESSVVVNVKAKQDLDLSLILLKKLVAKKNIEVFS
ncbi:MAG: hypothetical protein Q8830_02985 [Candidatus Phytoplasma australasiaticum]|nr:hypothetical protein [Candidatus Phytoplasma australasiaticum]